MPDYTQSPSDIPTYSQKDLTLADVMKELKDLRREVDGVNYILTGNGNPMMGMIVRINLLEQWRKVTDRRGVMNVVVAIICIINFIIMLANIGLLWEAFLSK